MPSIKALCKIGRISVEKLVVNLLSKILLSLGFIIILLTTPFSEISILILASFNDLKIADLCTIWKMVVHSAKQITAPKFQKVMNDPSADPC